MLTEKDIEAFAQLDFKCDMENVNEAFRLMKEAETEREKNKYIKYYQKVLRESQKDTLTKKFWEHPSKPLSKKWWNEHVNQFQEGAKDGN